MSVSSYLARPRAGATSLTAREVAAAYGFPLSYTGAGFTCGIIELGGGFTASDLTAAGLDPSRVAVVPVRSGNSRPDGPNGADAEVMLDVEVVLGVAPGASVRAYFADNTDAGFLAAIQQAVAECDVVSISWGGPENTWAVTSLDSYDATFAAARQAGVLVFCAAGDAGSGDGERGRNVDFPASSPHVIGCGGTRLMLNADDQRASETVWNDSTSSATGGGVSSHFANRAVPDIAGNADPVTGYQIVVDGEHLVVGGTSAVAPLYAGLALLLCEALGGRVGHEFDLPTVFEAHPEIFFDVTAGTNGAYRAEPGRDDCTGYGVLDGGKLLAVLRAASEPPAPVPTPEPAPTPEPGPDAFPAQAYEDWRAALKRYEPHPYSRHKRTAFLTVSDALVVALDAYLMREE